MENKVKIWGKEVERCFICTYYNGYEGCCNITGEYIDPISNDNINNKCPFLKPITQEVIESFGFKYIKTHPGTTESYFELPNSEWGIDFDPDWNFKPFIRIYEFGCDGDTTFFSGVINNPIELEFILKSVGVIE